MEHLGPVLVFLLLGGFTILSEGRMAPGFEPMPWPMRDPCGYFHCSNGGRCTAPADRPFCICPPGFKGRRCQERIGGGPISRDPCATFECENGGSCTAPADLPYCQCPPGFTGRRCETRTFVGGPSLDECGGCPEGSSCRPTNFLCVRAPCPTHQCVPSSNGGISDDACGGCPPKKTCRLIYPPCAPPPTCDLLQRLRRDTWCAHYECKPVHVCM